MLDLNNRNWASFKISDLFQPARGTEKNMTSLQSETFRLFPLETAITA